MVFYEAPRKLYATLRDMLDAWGDRRIAIVRELTKIHEEVIRTTLSEACLLYTSYVYIRADRGHRGRCDDLCAGCGPF